MGRASNRKWEKRVARWRGWMIKGRKDMADLIRSRYLGMRQWLRAGGR